MKRTLLAAALCATSAMVAAQQPTDIPGPKCEKPRRPGESLMNENTVRRQFEREIKSYRECMLAFIEARKVSIKAHEGAGNAAIEEYNATMKELNSSPEEKENKNTTKTGPGTSLQSAPPKQGN
jgi:hypothetical protein